MKSKFSFLYYHKWKDDGEGLEKTILDTKMMTGDFRKKDQ